MFTDFFDILLVGGSSWVVVVVVGLNVFSPSGSSVEGDVFHLICFAVDTAARCSK